MAARIDDKDSDCEDDDWQEESGGVTYPLRADRWWPTAGVLDQEDESGRCLGIRCNIWVRAKRRRDIIHQLRGGGAHSLGWGALTWTETSSRGECRFGPHPVLRHLSKKVANFLHEYHGDQFDSIALPVLPSKRSALDVHSMLGPVEIALLLRRLYLQPAMKDMGHFRLFGTLQIGHTTYPGFQRVQCWPFPELRYYGSNREDLVFIRPPGVEAFVLSPESVWYCRVRLLFTLSVKVDTGKDPVEMQCAFVSVCEEIVLDESGEIQIS